MAWLTEVLNEGGEHCRNCSTSDAPIWRVLNGREIEKCPNCGDKAFDVYDWADDGPNPYECEL
jgi:RNA polymerase subunit RPABC4/transcription elongation factor Spt4